MQDSNRFYVYVLFDWRGVPRYVGKGQGNRWIQHERYTDPINTAKNEFIERTWIVLGEIPKIKVRENIEEIEAFTVEVALVKAIGRADRKCGPLVNMTDGGDGTSGERTPKFREVIRSIWANRTPQQRSAIALKGIATQTAEQLTERGRKRAAKVPTEIKRERMKQTQADRPAAVKSADRRKGGLANDPKQQRENLAVGRAVWHGNATLNQYQTIYATGLGRLTKQQLSEAGKLGAAKTNSKLTAEQRSAAGRHARMAQLASKPK